MKHGEDHGRQMDFTDWLGAWTHAHIAPANVWIGVSAGADQAAALAIPARVHFLSCEPMLHEMDATHAADFDWIIFGGESGPNARFCATRWIRKGVEFCAANGIAAFVKQLGANCGFSLIDKKGGGPKEWPADLRVREFPSAKAGTSQSAGSAA
jgi:protein gp37